MTQMITKQLLQIRDIESILEDNVPQFPVETEVLSPDVAARLRVQKSTNVGAKITLSVHSFHFGQENIQKLISEARVESTLLEGLQQPTDASPVPADGLRSHLKQAVGSRNAKELWCQHKSAIEKICGINSVIILEEWDPHSWLGSLTMGSAWNQANRGTFVKQLYGVLTQKIEHSSAQSSECFIATAAAGNADDPCVVTLRHFRDDCLIHNGPGRLAIRLYGVVGPRIAKRLRRSRLACRITYRVFVQPSAYLVSCLSHVRTGNNGKES